MSFHSFEIVEKLMIAKKGEAMMKECQELVDQMTNALSDAKSKLSPLEAKYVLKKAIFQLLFLKRGILGRGN